MSGKRLLDVVALINASRAVAAHHLSIRLKQLDGYRKTSILGRAASKLVYSPNQFRFSVIPSGSSAHAVVSQQSCNPKSEPPAKKIPSVESVQGKKAPSKGAEGLEQDHHYRPEDSYIPDDVPNQDLEVRQQKARQYPLPDGTIPLKEHAVGKFNTDQDVCNHSSPTDSVKKPLDQHESRSTGLEPESSCSSNIPDPDVEPSGLSGLSLKDAKVLQRQSESQIPSEAAEPPTEKAYRVSGFPFEERPGLGLHQERDSFYQAPDRTSPVLSSLPRVKLPKNAGNVQGGNRHIKEDVNADVFYSSDDKGEGSGVPEQTSSQGPKEPSKEMMNQIFRSPRVARLLGNKGQFGNLKPKSTTFPRRKSTSSVQRINQDVKNPIGGPVDVSPNLSTEGVKPAPWAKREMHDIVKLAAGVEKNAKTPPTVSMSRTLNPRYADKLTGYAQMSSQKSPVVNSSPFEMRESRVPSSRVGRLWQYGGLAASMALGAAGEGIKRATGSVVDNGASLMLSDSNMERLVAKLSKMRGAALKLGQMMSFQGQSEPLYHFCRKLMISQIRRCFRGPFKKFSNVCKIARITCPSLNGTRFWQVILDPSGVAYSNLLRKNLWLLLPSARSTAPF